MKNACLLLLGLCLASAPGSAEEASVAGPRISIEPASFDFGKALPNKTLTKDFVLKNIGTEDLVIERVTTTCGCTVASGWSKLVKPGDATTLKVSLATRTSRGRLERKVLVKSNDPQKDTAEVTVVATVEAAEAAPKD
jgi:Protein of unknown function (DUF1573)